MKKTAIIITISLLSAFCFSQESTLPERVNLNRPTHLEPVSGFFNTPSFRFQYYSLINDLLFKEIRHSIELQYLVTPSFSPEYLLLITHNKDNGKYYLQYNIGSENIWQCEDTDKYKLDSFYKEIDPESVLLIKKLFKSFLLNVRYIEKDMFGSDGTNYYFSLSEMGTMEGKIWSPSKGSNPDRLIKVCERIIKLSMKKQKFSLEEKFRNEIKTLTQEQ